MNTFNTAVQMRLGQAGPSNYIPVSSLTESLKLVLKMVTVFNEPRSSDEVTPGEKYENTRLRQECHRAPPLLQQMAPDYQRDGAYYKSRHTAL